ncbi:MAG: cytoplasmic protein, partial [Deltaproteobacteria bacterium]|nr:cytoplasmic protein [Deltaproteobacteria bacterium]
KVASIKQLTPIKVDGERDESRPIMFIGQTQLMSQMGPVPVQCDIEAENLEEALGKFPAAVQVAVEKMIEEAREMQRQEAHKIVIPGQEDVNKIIT